MNRATEVFAYYGLSYSADSLCSNAYMSLMLVSVSDIVACLFASRASEIGRRSKYDRLLNSSTVYFNPTTGMKYISIYIYIQLTDGVSWFFYCIFAFVPDVSCCAPRIDPADYSNHFIVAWSSIVIHDMQLQI